MVMNLHVLPRRSVQLTNSIVLQCFCSLTDLEEKQSVLLISNETQCSHNHISSLFSSPSEMEVQSVTPEHLRRTIPNESHGFLLTFPAGKLASGDLRRPLE